MPKPTVLATAWHAAGASALALVIRRLRKEKRVHVEAVAYDVANGCWHDIRHRTLERAYGNPSYKTARKMIEHLTPALILTGTSDEDKNHPTAATVWEKQVIAAARDAGIPTVSVIDAWMNYRRRFDDGKKLAFMPTKIAVIDKRMQKEMTNEGFSRERLVITGNPHHDELLLAKKAFTRTKRAQIRKALGLAQDLPVVLYCSGPYHQKQGTSFFGFDEYTILEDLLDALHPNRGVQLVIKLHPMEERDLHKFDAHLARARAKGIPAVLFPPHLSKTYSLFQVLKSVNVVCSPTSTSLWEAAALGVPAVSVQLGRRCADYLAPFTTCGIIPLAETRKKLSLLLASVLYYHAFLREIARAKQDSIKKGITWPDGHATTRMTALVYKMLAARH
jgi:hypothetical protein